MAGTLRRLIFMNIGGVGVVFLLNAFLIFAQSQFEESGSRGQQA
jgi:hypothetical protein